MTDPITMQLRLLLEPSIMVVSSISVREGANFSNGQSDVQWEAAVYGSLLSPWVRRRLDAERLFIVDADFARIGFRIAHIRDTSVGECGAGKLLYISFDMIGKVVEWKR